MLIVRCVATSEFPLFYIFDLLFKTYSDLGYINTDVTLTDSFAVLHHGPFMKCQPTPTDR